MDCNFPRDIQREDERFDPNCKHFIPMTESQYMKLVIDAVTPILLKYKEVHRASQTRSVRHQSESPREKYIKCLCGLQ